VTEEQRGPCTFSRPSYRLCPVNRELTTFDISNYIERFGPVYFKKGNKGCITKGIYLTFKRLLFLKQFFTMNSQCYYKVQL